MTWKCDTCGETIDSVEAGWVEWKTDAGSEPKYRRHSFRLVHNQKKCQYVERTFPSGTSLADLPLQSFVGEDGLMTLLEFMSDHPTSLDELIELTKRLHIAGYDEARGSFDAAIYEGVFEPNTKPRFYSLSQIKSTVEWARKRGD